MAAASVLTREKDFEDLLGTGKSFVAPDRQYIRLADDVSFPRSNYALEEIKEHALRAQQKRRFWEDLSNAARKPKEQFQPPSHEGHDNDDDIHNDAVDTSR